MHQFLTKISCNRMHNEAFQAKPRASLADSRLTKDNKQNTAYL